MMRNYIFAFTAGFVIGSVVMQKILKRRYEAICQEGNESVMVDYHNTHMETFSEKDSPPNSESDEDYISEAHRYKSANEETPRADPTPYIISPDEFGEKEDYDTISLTYYQDGILTDENDEPLENAEQVIGLNVVEHFGEYEEDSVFVRNDIQHCDYEILRDERCYSEVSRTHPGRRQYV